MIQDYPALRSPCIKSLSQNHEELSIVLSKVQNFATSSYLVELISQLENKALVTLIFSQNPDLCEKFPENCYANDPPCLKFLELTQFDASIYKFSSFSIGNSLKSGASFCQITSKYLIALLDHNDFAAPIQFDLPNIRQIKRNGTQVSFNLMKSAKKALINIDIPSYATIILNFQTETLTKKFMTNFEEVASKVVLSTPRKISVVQNFIALSGCYGDIEGEEEGYDDGISEDDIAPPPPPDSGEKAQEFCNSGLIEETESLFGSPINTTKDTTVSKKIGRAVSIIVAESNPDKHNAHAASSQIKGFKGGIFGSDNFEQVPDSLDQAFETFNNPPVNRGPSDVVVDSLPESNKQTVSLQDPKKSNDIWDFESDPDLSLNNPKATSTTNKKYKSKAMKCLTTQVNATEKKRTTKKVNGKVKNPDVKSKVNAQLEKVNKSEMDVTLKDSQSSIDSVNNHPESFLPLTSPMEIAHQRARTRAYSKAITNDKIISANTADEKAEENLQTNDRKRPLEEHDAKEVNDKSVKKTKQTANRPKKTVKKHTAKPVARVMRGKKKNSEDQLRGKETSAPAETKTEQKVKPLETQQNSSKTKGVEAPITQEQGVSRPTNVTDKSHAVLESTRLLDTKDQENQPLQDHRAKPVGPSNLPQVGITQPQNFSLMSSALSGPLAADTILSEAYTNTLQRQIFESITTFSNQLVKKIHIINDEINKKVMTDLTSKYETLFNDLRDSFQSDVDEMCGFIVDVKGLLNLPEQELINYIKQKKFGTIAGRK